MEVGLYIFNNKDRALTESMRFCHFSNSNLTIPAKLVVDFNPLGLSKKPHTLKTTDRKMHT